MATKKKMLQAAAGNAGEAMITADNYTNYYVGSITLDISTIADFTPNTSYSPSLAVGYDPRLITNAYTVNSGSTIFKGTSSIDNCTLDHATGEMVVGWSNRNTSNGTGGGIAHIRFSDETILHVVSEDDFGGYTARPRLMVKNPSNRILFASGSGANSMSYIPSTKTTGSWTTPGSAGNSPRGLYYDQTNGYKYLMSYDSNIWYFAPTGDYTSNSSFALSYSSDGSIPVNSRNANRIDMTDDYIVYINGRRLSYVPRSSATSVGSKVDLTTSISGAATFSNGDNFAYSSGITTGTGEIWLRNHNSADTNYYNMYQRIYYDSSGVPQYDSTWTYPYWSEYSSEYDAGYRSFVSSGQLDLDGQILVSVKIYDDTDTYVEERLRVYDSSGSYLGDAEQDSIPYRVATDPSEYNGVIRLGTNTLISKEITTNPNKIILRYYHKP